MVTGTPPRVVVSEGDGFRRVVDALRVIDESMAERLRLALSDAIKPLMDEARARVESLPVHGIKHTGLRGRVAAGVGMKISDRGVQVYASMNRSSEASLPAYLDADTGWRHPVYGNRHTWVLQTTGGAWFTETFEQGEPDLRQALQDVLDRARDDVQAAEE